MLKDSCLNAHLASNRLLQCSSGPSLSLSTPRALIVAKLRHPSPPNPAFLVTVRVRADLSVRTNLVLGLEPPALALSLGGCASVGTPREHEVHDHRPHHSGPDDGQPRAIVHCQQERSVPASTHCDEQRTELRWPGRQLCPHQVLMSRGAHRVDPDVVTANGFNGRI